MFSKCIERGSIPDQLESDINIIKKEHINVELTSCLHFKNCDLKLFTEEAFFTYKGRLFQMTVPEYIHIDTPM